MLVRKPLDISGRHQLRKTISRLLRVQDDLFDKSPDHLCFDAQQRPGLAVVQESFSWHADARHRPIFTYLLGSKKVSGNARKSFGIADWCETAVNDSSDYASEAGLTAQIVRHGVAQSD